MKKVSKSTFQHNSLNDYHLKECRNLLLLYANDNMKINTENKINGLREIILYKVLVEYKL